MGIERTVAKKRTRRKYTAEFKANAVKLATAAGSSVSEVAGDLGVHETNLYEWVKRSKEQQDGGLSFEEREELVRLRREMKRLRMERDVLEKASLILGGSET